MYRFEGEWLDLDESIRIVLDGANGRTHIGKVEPLRAQNEQNAVGEGARWR